ncbi:MAG: V-type ATPase subunit [Chloroflexota bacterium]
MRSRLLTGSELEQMTASADIQALIAALAHTPYGPSIEKALVRTGGIECVTLALRLDLEKTVNNVTSYFTGRAADTVAVVLGSYDVANLKAILRGLVHGHPTREILDALAPLGTMAHDFLVELSRAPDVRAAIDTLASARSPLAQPLLQLRASRPSLTIVEMELSLDKWYFAQALDHAQAESGANGTLVQALQQDVDLLNIITVLRLVHAPDERRRLQDSLDAGDATRLFLPGGSLSPQTLQHAAEETTVAAAIDVLEATRYGPPLIRSLPLYQRAGRLSVFEEQLHRYHLRWRIQQITRDPLGPGVLLGYLPLKQNEVRNLRWIAGGIYLGMEPAAIQEELVFVP